MKKKKQTAIPISQAPVSAPADLSSNRSRRPDDPDFTWTLRPLRDRQFALLAACPETELELARIELTEHQFNICRLLLARYLYDDRQKELTKERKELDSDAYVDLLAICRQVVGEYEATRQKKGTK